MISINNPHEKSDEVKNERPRGLLILFVLTAINTSTQLLSSVAGVFSGSADSVAMEEVKFENARLIKSFRDMGSSEDMLEVIRKMEVITLATLENLQLMSFLMLLFSGLGLYGALTMFRGLKKGFHMYIAYSFLCLIQYYFIVSPSEIPIYVMLTNGSVSLLFVYLYSRHLTWMK